MVSRFQLAMDRGPDLPDDVVVERSRWESIVLFFRLLKPYFWPTGCGNKVAAMACFALLGISKGCSIASPAFMGIATDALIRKDWVQAAGAIAATTVLRFLVTTFEEAQRIVYLRVKEAAYVQTSDLAFQHLHSLSLDWHIKKKAGTTLRALDRGLNSATTIVDLLFLRLVPTIIEMIVLLVLFSTLYESGSASGVLAGGFILYFLLTIQLATWRKKTKKQSSRADNEAHQIAVDSLTNFETVKSFRNEEWERQRYNKAVALFQKSTKLAQMSLGTVNISQVSRGAGGRERGAQDGRVRDC